MKYISLLQNQGMSVCNLMLGYFKLEFTNENIYQMSAVWRQSRSWSALHQVFLAPASDSGLL